MRLRNCILSSLLFWTIIFSNAAYSNSPPIRQATLVFQQKMNPSATYTGSYITSIGSGFSNYGYTSRIYAGLDWCVWRGLLKFDLSIIPSGVLINNAVLELFCEYEVDSVDADVSIHKVSTDWGRRLGSDGPAANGEACWTWAKTNVLEWNIAGGDFESAEATEVTTEKGKYFSFSIPKMVQDWVDNPGLNYGLLVMGEEGTQDSRKGFRTPEYSYENGMGRPRLTVSYSPSIIPNQFWPMDTVKDDAFDLTDYFSDPDGDILTYNSEGTENIEVVIGPDSKVNFIPAAGWHGTETVIFTADDGHGGVSQSNPVDLTVYGLVTIPNQRWAQNTSFDNAFDLDDYFLDSEPLIYSASLEDNPDIDVIIDSDNMVSFSQPGSFYGAEAVVFTATNISGSREYRSEKVFLCVDKTGEYKYKLEHPRLPHPSSAFITKLQGNTAELAKYTQIADGLDPNAPGNSSNIRSLLVAYLATGDPVYLGKIKALAGSPYPNFGTQSILYALSMAYDWIYYDLDSQSRTAFVERIDEMCLQWKQDYAVNIQVSPYNDVGYVRLGAGLFLGAIAIYPDHPDGRDHFDFAEDVLFDKYIPVWHQIMGEGLRPNEGGGWHEGIEYVYLGIGQVIIPALSSWSTATEQNIFYENSWLENLVYYPIYTTRPDLTPLRIGDVAWCIRNYYPDLLALSVIYDNPYGRWWARETKEYGPKIPSGFESSGWPWVEPDIPEAEVRPPDDLPLTRYFDGWGVIVMRSGWTEDDTMINFRVGDNFWSHQHFDSGSFTIYKRGALAIDSGTYSAGYNSDHHIKYQMQTVAHNAVTVTDPQDDNYPDDRYGLPNDGGQRRVGSLYTHAPDDIGEWMMQKEDYEMGNIITLESVQGYDYVLGDITTAYNNMYSGTGDYRSRTRRIDKFTRSVVFIRPDCFIVFDRVTAIDPNFEKRWLLHSINEPEVNGNETAILRADNVRHQYSWPNGLIYRSADRLYYQYDGKLFCKTLLPEDFEIVKVGGPGREFEVNGVNYNQTLGSTPVDTDPTKGPQEPGAWRIEVKPTTPVNHDLFLNVMYATVASTPAMPPTSRIDADTMVGALIPGTAILFSRIENVVAAVRYQLMGNGIIRNMLADMIPNESYDVYRDGMLYRQIAASRSGMLVFDLDVTTTHNIEVRQTGSNPPPPELGKPGQPVHVDN